MAEQAGQNVLTFGNRVYTSTLRAPFEAQVEVNMADPNTPSREEISAKLEAAEARTETRFVMLDGKIDRLLDSVSALSTNLTEVKGEIKEVRKEVKEDSKFTRWTIAGIILAAVGALWVTQGNLLSAFQSGLAVKDTTTTQKPAATK